MSLEGLAKYRASKEKKTNSNSNKFYKPAPDTKVKIRPLQELDSDSKNLSKKNGLARFTVEWQHPLDFTKVVVDTTEEEGACVPADLSREYGWGDNDNPGWKPRDRVYFNAVVDDGENDPFVGIIQLNLGGKALGETLVKFSDGREDHSITNRWWDYERVGKGQYDTTYSLIPQDPSAFDVEKIELLDIEESLPNVPYASQSSYLGVQAWIEAHGDKVKAATKARFAGKNNKGDKEERTPTQVSQEW